MPHSIRIEDGVVREIWRDTAKADLVFHPDLLATIYETEIVDVEEGDTYDPETGDLTAAEPAGPSPIISYSAFRARWTDAEKELLFAEMNTDWRVQDLIALGTAQNAVNIGSATGAQAKALFVSLGVLTQERADEIFTP